MNKYKINKMIEIAILLSIVFTFYCFIFGSHFNHQLSKPTLNATIEQQNDKLINDNLNYPINSITNTLQSQNLADGTKFVDKEDLTLLISRIGINRTAFSRGEKDASSYLASLMTNLNLSFYKDQSTFIKEFSLNKNKSQNVIGVKKSNIESNKYVILGAHYDNAYSINGEQTNSNGVFDNASGLLCLITIMNELNAIDLPYNIIYIFYGAEEVGLYGSKNFVSSLSSIEKKNILFALNFDSIGIGEETYFYSGDSNNAYKKIFANTFNIKEIPTNKRLNLLTNFEGFAYTHIGLMSDNATYLKHGIKCTTFFSGNLSHSGSGYIESVSHENLTHTKNDNIEYILSTYPNFLNNINNVANLSINVLQTENLESTIKSCNSGLDLFFLNNKVVMGAIFLAGIIILTAIKPHNRNNLSNKQSN